MQVHVRDEPGIFGSLRVAFRAGDIILQAMDPN